MDMLLLMLISFILAALSVVSLVKNFFVNFNVSDNGWKTVLVVILLLICLFGAAFGYSESYTVRDIKALLLSPGQTTAEEIKELQNQLPLRTGIAVISIIVGYAAYFINTRVLGSIKKDRLRQMEQNKNNRWVKKSEA